MGVFYGARAIGYLQAFDAWFRAQAPALAVATLAAVLAALGVWASRRLRARPVGGS
jgi:hypothetical protein